MKEKEKWKPCRTCHTCKTCAITMTVQSTKCMMCISRPGAPGWEPGVNYCPNCGRPVTAKAWEEHRERKRGGGYGKKS